MSGGWTRSGLAAAVISRRGMPEWGGLTPRNGGLCDRGWILAHTQLWEDHALEGHCVRIAFLLPLTFLAHAAGAMLNKVKIGFFRGTEADSSVWHEIVVGRPAKVLHRKALTCLSSRNRMEIGSDRASSEKSRVRWALFYQCYWIIVSSLNTAYMWSKHNSDESFYKFADVNLLLSCSLHSLDCNARRSKTSIVDRVVLWNTYLHIIW